MNALMRTSSRKRESAPPFTTKAKLRDAANAHLRIFEQHPELRHEEGVKYAAQDIIGREQ